jgi:hypothetical protein
MANLVAYRSLPLFPSAAPGGNLAVSDSAFLDEQPNFTCPIWELPTPPDTVR